MIEREKNMKIAFFSDLHVNISSNNLGFDIRKNIIKVIQDEKPNMIIIAGDISDFAIVSIRFIEQIEKETGIKVLFIPGNHDIWDDKDSWSAYNLFKNHHSTLIDNPRILDNGYVIIGDMGWYDYSFGPQTLSDYDIENTIAEHSKEGQYRHWGMKDRELCEIMLDKFTQQLDKYKDNKIIFINHFIPYNDFITSNSDFNWNVLNSIMGSKNIGMLLDRYQNIEYIVFGHTHKRYGTVEFGVPKVICNPLGYAREWLTQYSPKDIERDIQTIVNNEIKASMTIIEI
jgi:putative phosphoesterase